MTSNRDIVKEGFDLAIDFQAEEKPLIFEVKMAESEDELETEAKDALHRLHDKNCATEYPDYQCLIIGVSLFGKKMSDFHTEILQPL